MIIDTHVHVLDTGFWPDAWFDWVAQKWASGDKGRHGSAIRDRIEPGLIDSTGEQMIADMDAAGVDVSVLLPLDWGPDFPERVPIEEVNRHAVELAARFPDRFVAFVGVDPRRPQALELVETLLSAGQVRGLKLYPPAGFDPFDERLHPIYEICIEHAAPVLFHTGETLPKLRVRYADPVLLQDVHAAYPDLITFIGHAGARLWWPEALSVAANSINSYLELSVWVWDDMTEEREHDFIHRLAKARDVLGVERLIFGSDHLSGPRIRGRAFLSTVVDWYRNLPERAAEFGIRFTTGEVDALLGGNAAGLLGLADHDVDAASQHCVDHD